MKLLWLLPLLFFPWPSTLSAADTLSVAECRRLATQQHPLQQQKALAASIQALDERNNRSANLPRISFGGQASWQTDVFNLPFDSPLLNAPEIPADQYRISLDASQKIYDGGSTRLRRKGIELDRNIQEAQTDIDAYAVRELVTELYANALLLQETDTLLGIVLDDLDNRLRQAEAGVAGGVALRTSADQIRIQILKTEQQRNQVRSDFQTAKTLLALWINRPAADFSLQSLKKPGQNTAIAMARPEHRMFELQKQALQLKTDMLGLQVQPRIEGFVQAGLGRPNPLNFFETDLQPFAILGVRAVWTPVLWGKKSRDAQILSIQAQQIEVRKEAFDKQLSAAITKELGEADKIARFFDTDDQIIALQEDILARTEAQYNNGVATMTDYLAQVNLLNQARLTRKTHEIQMWKALEIIKAKSE